jgi:group I intron endonuclease
MPTKKELIRQYKQTLQPMGVYQIKNLTNGKIFIGSSANIPGKFNSHKFQLRQGVHMNKELQNDFRQLGEEKFAFEVLDTLEPKEDPKYNYADDLKTLEEMWLEKLRPYDEKGYHTRKISR